ncbi:hypothetical protein BLNAU_694 [Blattamonas nauphoetae]|uniref:Uncharacterized protein n=1 Tax=Blattamonas nauphoetae TaxID=2049346 RepID=A0ABQ9YKA0_9EUKA|nr:hypothetical protein BLNAU_694 [Blattamonas nauphoetae]
MEYKQTCYYLGLFFILVTTVFLLLTGRYVHNEWTLNPSLSTKSLLTLASITPYTILACLSLLTAIFVLIYSKKLPKVDPRFRPISTPRKQPPRTARKQKYH